MFRIVVNNFLQESFSCQDKICCGLLLVNVEIEEAGEVKFRNCMNYLKCQKCQVSKEFFFFFYPIAIHL